MKDELSPKGKRRARLWGSFFIFLGIPGIILPFLQGIPLILIGLVFFSLTSPRMHSFLMWMKKKNPYVHKTIVYAEEKVKDWFALETK